MRVLAVVFGVVLFVAGDASAQERCLRRYYGDEHDRKDWTYLTIDANSRGMPRSSGISIFNRPTLVCGHDDDQDANGVYCVDPDAHEWRRVWACGSGDDDGGDGGGGDGGNGGGGGGGGGDGGDGGNSGGRVRLSMDGDSEWVMEDAGPTQVTVEAELTGGTRDAATHVDVRLDPHEASADDFETSARNFRIVIPVNQRSGSHTFTFTPVDDTTEESDENLRFTGDTGAANLPVDPTTLMIKDNDGAVDPAFSERSYAFDLPEERDGRTEPYRLGVVTAADPAAHPLTYTLATGDGSRFEVDGSSGAIAYVGPGEDYETGPRDFELTLAARNGDSRTASARVTVKVIDVPEAPAAADDMVEMPEDETIVVDVLANDTDGDGQPLTVVSVTAPEHGETTVANGGGVRYAPSRHYHGPDRFDYTVSDPDGFTDTATVVLNVLPVNDAPQAVGTIPEQALEEGGEPLTLELAPYFTDVDGDGLTYTAESSNPAATTVAVSGSTLTLSAVVRGMATVTVTAADPGGLAATQVFGIAVGDRFARDVLTDLLAAFGRGHLSSVRQTVGRRLETAGAETPRVALAGQHFSPLMWNRLGTGGLSRTHEWYFRAAMLQQRQAATDLLGTSGDPRFREADGFLGVGSFGGGWDRALLGSNLLLPFGGDGEGATGSGYGRSRWTVWGQGDLQTFRGTPQAVSGYEGDLRTGYLGVDVQVTRGWLLGAAVARSGGAGTWERGESGGDLSTKLTQVYPYVRWANDDTAVWGVLGVGRGSARTHVRTLTGLSESSDLGLGLGLLEGRRRVATVGGGVDIGLRGEASWARLATGDGEETIDDLAAGVRRMRAGVELLRPFSAAGGLTWTPFGALSTRHDGGAGQTGVGLEVAGGLRVGNRRVQLEAQGRRLVVHSATGYEDYGASLAASMGSGPYEPGLTLSVRPTWGAPGMGAETLWQDRFHTYRQGSGYDAAGIDARLGYGVELPWGSVLTPFGAYAQREDARRFEVGAVMASLGELPGALEGPIELEVSGERYERPGGKPDHRVGMFGVVNLGGGKASPETATNGDPTPRVPAPVPAPVPDARPPAPLRSKPLLAVLPLDRPFAPAPVDGAAVSELTLAVAPTVPAVPMTSEPEPGLPAVSTTAPGDAATDGSPVFSTPTYTFDLALPREKEGATIPLGAVLARDPEGDPVTYSLQRGDGRRFAVDPSTGTVTYTWSLEDLLAGAARHELTVTARDRGRRVQSATVVVTMESFGGVLSEEPGAGEHERPATAARAAAPAPAGPPADGGAASPSAAAARSAATTVAADARRRAAVADAARTLGAVPVLIDVLANDAEPGGLRIVAMTAPAHGTATVTDGRVRYMPEPGYLGRDTFTYTVVSASGLTSRATVTVTVTDAE